MSELTVYQERRKKLLPHLKKNSVVILKANSLVTKSHDTHYPFRQSSNFKYLLGINEPEAYFVLTTKDNIFKQYLFVRDKNPELEMWNGVIPGPDKCRDLTDVDECLPLEKLHRMLPELISGHNNVYFEYHKDNALREKIQNICLSLSRDKRKKVVAPESFNDLNTIIGTLRLFKDKQEMNSMRQACKATAQAHIACMKFAKPGRNESEVEALLEFIFKLNGTEGIAYDSIVAGGNNANILHYIENNQSLKDGDLLLIDAGSQMNLYASDVTRTFPINGKFTPAQKEIYELVLKSQKDAVNMICPGVFREDIEAHVCHVLTQGLLDLGILKGTLDEHLANKTVKKYYPHGIGHWLGLDVHDESPYLDENNERIQLDPGMVLTIEPGLYFNETDSTVPPKYRGIGIRIEDDILVTKDSFENLTSSIPKEVKEIEDVCCGLFDASVLFK